MDGKPINHAAIKIIFRICNMSGSQPIRSYTNDALEALMVIRYRISSIAMLAHFLSNSERSHPPM